MNLKMNLKNRWLWVGVVALVTLVLLSLFVTPRSIQLQQGSTYSRAPSGYGAWYAYLEQQIPVRRWQRPLNQLFEGSNAPETPSVKRVVNRNSGSQIQEIAAIQPEKLTLIQISPNIGSTSSWNQDWIERGNRLILVGRRTPVTKAPFRSKLPSSVGAVQIDTTRRYDLNRVEPPGRSQIKPLLQDTYGTVVWEEQIGQGQVIQVVPPYFAANAYQAQPGNFKFLAQLATEAGYPIYIDEYLHGYKDQEAIAAEQAGSVLGYLARTPLLLIAIQSVVLLLVLIWGQQRFGPPKRVSDTKIDNSEAYIQALATVLHKANCGDFVIQTIGKAEQLQIQRALGLGSTLLQPEALLAAWTQRTGESTTELEAALAPVNSQQIRDRTLSLWLKKWQTVRRQLE